MSICPCSLLIMLLSHRDVDPELLQGDYVWSKEYVYQNLRTVSPFWNFKSCIWRRLKHVHSCKWYMIARALRCTHTHTHADMRAHSHCEKTNAPQYIGCSSLLVQVWVWMFKCGVGCAMPLSRKPGFLFWKRGLTWKAAASRPKSLSRQHWCITSTRQAPTICTRNGLMQCGFLNCCHPLSFIIAGRSCRGRQARHKAVPVHTFQGDSSKLCFSLPWSGK